MINWRGPLWGQSVGWPLLYRFWPRRSKDPCLFFCQGQPGQGLSGGHGRVPEPKGKDEDPRVLLSQQASPRVLLSQRASPRVHGCTVPQLTLSTDMGHEEVALWDFSCPLTSPHFLCMTDRSQNTVVLSRKYEWLPTSNLDFLNEHFSRETSWKS